MLIRKSLWLISLAQFLITIRAGFWDKDSEVGSDESQTAPIGKAEYGVDMVRPEYFS
jgi:hypothetical protein